MTDETYRKRDLTPSGRRRLQQKLLDTAVPLAEKYGYQFVESAILAKEAGCSPGLVRQAWGRQDRLDAIMREAIRRGNEVIAAQGIVAADPLALGAPMPLRQRAVSWFKQAAYLHPETTQAEGKIDK